MSQRNYYAVLCSVLGLAFAWSAWQPLDRFTWWLEIAPILIALPIVLYTHARFQFSRLVYGLMLVHAVILLVGGHYTYAEMPVFNWLRDNFELARNYYDRLGHFAQGFVPAMVAREILLRTSPLKPGKWLFFLVTCVCLAISACYEFLEWWVALASGSDATAFLATQGDVWDTQWDMLMALIGAICAQVFLAKAHDSALHINGNL
ncbi:MAG: DUF2238 domain-containing protein [Methylophilaceae bacterium]|nr:DUF2238 domain-containing protein [Methylophilaceae bacterium]